MNPLLAHALRAARRRRLAVALLSGLPLVAGVAVLAGWLLGTDAAAPAAAVSAALLAMPALQRLRRMDARWATGQLDARPDLEDSSDLLLAAPETLGPLQQLQRQRLLDRLHARPADLREPWPRRALAVAWLLAGALVIARLAWPAPPPSPAAAVPVVPDAVAEAGPPRLVASDLQVRPPAYTGLPERRADGLSTRAPQGSTLAWRLRFEGEVDAVALVPHAGGRIALRREGGVWTGEAVLEASMLYRIEVQAPMPPDAGPLHRVDMVPDRAPDIRALAPDRNLSLRGDGQSRWELVFEAQDDYGLGPARLVVTLAQGSGEQVTVSERRLPLRGEGDARTRRYAHALDLAASGMAEGDDLIVRLEVADNRAPTPQWSRSASFILRWPPPAAAEATGLEGLVQRALPAYFRSQRQIIIDIEALVPQRPRLPAAEFSSRSDAIGVDQRILRLRYGQFLGEENEPGPAPPPTGDHDHDDDHAGDGHDHGDAPAASSGLGGAVDVLQEYGHTHDDAEAATLLDPETRALLKQALDAMWSSEGELRTGQPERALPHAYRALDFIKQVQNATRIYLARTGLDLPPVDEARRLTGKREGIASRRDGLVAATPTAAPAQALWQALGTPGATPDLDGVAAWLQARPQDEATLDLLEALESLRAEPGCAACRDRLRARLWPLLPPAVPAAGARRPADEAGAAYLRALATEGAEP